MSPRRKKFLYISSMLLAAFVLGALALQTALFIWLGPEGSDIINHVLEIRAHD